MWIFVIYCHVVYCDIYLNVFGFWAQTKRYILKVYFFFIIVVAFFTIFWYFIAYMHVSILLSLWAQAQAEFLCCMNVCVGLSGIKIYALCSSLSLSQKCCDESYHGLHLRAWEDDWFPDKSIDYFVCKFLESNEKYDQCPKPQDNQNPFRFCQQTLCSHCCQLILFSASSAYKTVSGVNGPLVILDQVKVRKTADLRWLPPYSYFPFLNWESQFLILSFSFQLTMLAFHLISMNCTFMNTH